MLICRILAPLLSITLQCTTVHMKVLICPVQFLLPGCFTHSDAMFITTVRSVVLLLFFFIPMHYPHRPLVLLYLIGGRVAQWAVTLASTPMVVGSTPALRARDFWVPPCSASVFRSLHCGPPPSTLYSETLVSVLHCTSAAFTVLRAVPAEKTARSYRHRSLPYRLSLVR